MTISLTATIREGKAWLRKKLAKGHDCPLCHQYAKITPRPFNRGMFFTLVWLVRQYQIGGGRWVHIRNEAPNVLVIKANDYAFMRFWGVIENKMERNEEGRLKGSGLWRPTELGEGFILGRDEIPAKVYTFNGESWGQPSPELITRDKFRELKAGAFDYRELLALDPFNPGASSGAI